MTTKKKEQCTIPVVVCCRCGKEVVSKWAVKEQEEEMKEYIKCEKHLLEYRMQEEDMYWQ